MFFIPFMITLKTHYNSINKAIVYFITYIIPEFMLIFLLNYPYSTIVNLNLYLTFFLSFISFVNFYEIGYIYNETETIKTEVNPTKRLSDTQLIFYEKKKGIIYFERILLTITLNICLSFFISIRSLILFSAEELLCLSVFYLYNRIRNGRITQIIYLFLSILKYAAPIFCFSEKIDLSIILASIFVFPIVRTIEYKAHYREESNVNLFFRKYIIKYNVNKIPVFRVFATFVLLCISALLYLADICNWIPFLMCAYMFSYRFALWFAVKMGANFKGYLQTDKNYSKKGDKNENN